MLRRSSALVLDTFAVATLALLASGAPQCSDSAPEQEFVASDSVAGDGFGHSLAVSGDVALIGAPFAAGGGKV